MKMKETLHQRTIRALGVDDPNGHIVINDIPVMPGQLIPVRAIDAHTLELPNTSFFQIGTAVVWVGSAVLHESSGDTSAPQDGP